MTDLSETIHFSFPGKKIAILGDLVADQFLRGTISRVSREAPVFILRHDETETLAGGAANAAEIKVLSAGAMRIAWPLGSHPFVLQAASKSIPELRGQSTGAVIDPRLTCLERLLS